MAAGPHTFATYDVFTAERYQGNPLAIVSVRGNSLTQAQKQKIAREFNYSETVFLYDGEGLGKPRRMEIFTVDHEIPFAGHPVIGTAHFIFGALEKLLFPPGHDGNQARHQTQTTVLLTKAGPVTVNYNPYRQVAAAEVPHDVHVHSKRVPASAIFKVHPQLQALKESAKLAEKSFPAVSIVKGMTFALIDLTGFPESMAALKAGPTPDIELDEEWSPSFSGAMYYAVAPPPPSTPSTVTSTSTTTTSATVPLSVPPIHRLRARMIESNIEDPATGSGCCALTSYLAMELGVGKAEASSGTGGGGRGDRAGAGEKEKNEEKEGGKGAEAEAEAHHVFVIEQGVEMGRRSQICVEVKVAATAKEETKEGAKEEGKERKEGGKKATEVTVKEVMLSGKACFVMRGELGQVF